MRFQFFRRLAAAASLAALLLLGLLWLNDAAPGSGGLASLGEWLGAGAPASAERTPASDAAPFWRENEGRPAPLARPPQGAPGSFADLAEQVKPAIVDITVRPETAEEEAEEDEDFRAPRMPGFPFFRFPPPPRSPSRGSGTGFLISEDGYIITNEHVIDGAGERGEVMVRLGDERTLQAEVIGKDPNTDLALIKIESEQALPTLPLGDSDQVRPGDWVLAIGNALGLSGTVTAGIVSAKHRKINDDRFDDFIQTDAAINTGNSGGPLINLAGEVIGINTAVRRGANTIGFAVPVNIAKQVLPQLRQSGRVSRGWLGVSIQPVDKDMAELLELGEAGGALIAQVMEDSPAEQAGLQQGDVIVSFNRQPVSDAGDLQRLVAAQRGGSDAELEFVREGRRRTLSVTLDELDRDGPVFASSRERDDRFDTEDYGISVTELTPEMASRRSLENDNGVVISRVEPNAAEAGLQRGDVVLEVNREPVANIAQFKNLVRQADRSKGLLLLVRRGQRESFHTLKPAPG